MTGSDEKLAKVSAVLDTFADVDPAMPLARALTLTTVAKSQGSSVNEVAKSAGLKANTTSRHLKELADESRSGRPGLRLIQARPNVQDRRGMQFYLTPSGDDLFRAIGERMSKNLFDPKG